MQNRDCQNVDSRGFFMRENEKGEKNGWQEQER
jgi:hypothetical protein